MRVDERTIEEPERWVQSTCVLCSNGCGLDIGVRDGRIVGVRGQGYRMSKVAETTQSVASEKRGFSAILDLLQPSCRPPTRNTHPHASTIR